MLGGEQSGHIEAIGFEMYTSMLEEAVNKMKGEGDKPAHATTVLNLGISVRIDSDYIAEETSACACTSASPALSTRPPSTTSAPSCTTATAPRPTPCSTCSRPASSALNASSSASPSSTASAPRSNCRIGNKKQPLKVFVEMLHIKFAVPESAAGSSQDAADKTLARASIDPGKLMQLVARNAKKGAQFTPQGIFRWPLTGAKAEDVLAETRSLLESLEP